MKFLPYALFLFVPMFVIFIFSGDASYSSRYSAIYKIEQAKMDKRNSSGDFQAQAINKKINRCLYDAIVNQVYKNENAHSFSGITPTEALYAVNEAEAECTTDLLDNVAISNPKGARALGALLEDKNYTLSESYHALAKKDEVALASVQF